MADTNAADIVNLQAIERSRFINSLQADPAAYAAYVKEKKDAIMTEAIGTKRASFLKVSGDMARMMDMNHNSHAALLRTNDLISTQDQILNEQLKLENSKKINLDTTRRQVEINDWYYEDKRETLFVLQFILLVVLLITIILYLQYTGWISKDGAEYLMAFILVVGVGTLIYRWYYTKNIRDPRFWNRRKFVGDGNQAPATGEICIGLGGEGSGTDLLNQFEDAIGMGSGTGRPSIIEEYGYKYGAIKSGVSSTISDLGFDL
jgi:hypothetical protein